MLSLNYLGDESVVRIQTISEQQNIPKRFLEQILNDLKSARIVESKRGVAGGYRLRRPPQRINLAEVIRYLGIPLAPISCVSERFYEKCSCPDETRCAIRTVMKEVRESTVTILESVTLADLCERARRLKHEETSLADYVI